jgi:hypothetical protein
MMKKIILLVLLLANFSGYAQLFINELDSDTPGVDDKEFVEIRSITPFFPLDGYVIVFFNGSSTSTTGNRSYFAIDLDGLATDINGLISIGNLAVSPVPTRIFSNNVIQNGADGVAIYLGNGSDWPLNTLANNINLIDALVYDTSDPPATELMSLLGVSIQINENANGLGTTQSIQRRNDGTYEVKTPTPGVHNDGSGFMFNGITITPSGTQFTEGQSFNITFSTQTPVTDNPLQFTFSLNNGTFTSDDFTANLSVTIPVGASSAVVPVQLVDDSLDEGDELAVIRFGALPAAYNRRNDQLNIRIVDNDFTTSPWGTPLNPTYGVVSSTAPQGYYSSLEGKAGADLIQAIQDIIADPAVVRKHTYGDVTLILNQADQSPLHSNQVWLMYVEQQREKFKFQESSSNVGTWNREHIFPQSRGGFANATSAVADGINIFASTNADDVAAGHSDAHHIRAEDGPENTLRSNRDYGSDYNGPVGNQGSWKGDVARSLFYMAVRYNALSLVNGNPPDTTMFQIGDLASLLSWNFTDPADDFEMNRNNIVYTWQMNRNPFIDYPLLASYIWGGNAGQTWSFSLAMAAHQNEDVFIYPNPVTSQVRITGVQSGNLEVFSVTGVKVLQTEFFDHQQIELRLPSGVYMAKISSGLQVTTKKLVVR